MKLAEPSEPERMLMDFVADSRFRSLVLVHLDDVLCLSKLDVNRFCRSKYILKKTICL